MDALTQLNTEQGVRQVVESDGNRFPHARENSRT